MGGIVARMSEKYTMSASEAARALGVTPATIYAWCRSQEIPCVRLGSRIRIPTARLADLLGIRADDLTAALEPREGRHG